MAECPARRRPGSRWRPEAATPLRRARHAVSPPAPPGLLPSRPLLSRSPVPAATVAHRAVTDGAGISACHGPPTTVGHRAMTVRCPGRSQRGSARRRRLLRVVVDADGGVDLDNIALVSREASARLDDTGAMGEAPYTLEVSSPGVDRPLTQPRHWRRAVGRLVRVPASGPSAPGPRAPAHAAGQTGRKPVEGRVIAA